MAIGIRFSFLFVTALFVLCCVQEGFSIKCWVCRSDVDPNCADPFDNSTMPIVDCMQQPDLENLPGVRPMMCRKIIRRVDEKWTTFRNCAYIGEPLITDILPEQSCVTRTGKYNILIQHCTCNNKDGCNS